MVIQTLNKTEATKIRNYEKVIFFIDAGFGTWILLLH
jgi:hypothetical protein